MKIPFVTMAFLAMTLPASAAVLVQGTVVQEFTPTTWQKPFQVTPNSQATIVLEVGCSDQGQERSCERGLHQEIKVTRMPVAFVFESNDPELKCTAVDGQRCFLSALVESNKGTTAVGDLFTDSAAMIIAPARNFVLKAGGLEPCTDPNSGGECI